MDNDNLSELLSNMMNSGSIPDNVKDVLQGLSNNASNSSDTKSSDEVENSEGSKNSENSDDSSASSIDIGTILKIKSIIDSMNTKDDPRANLLYSLKPYLRDSRKGKLDQYVNLLNMTKLADVFKKEGGI